ncbi:hypothetical protein OIU77_015413 [Salix suchowensis]|uniref:Uncharacterized protein n=1 Tax=Salix suchowensis TaxID=1278906 RepID=A0ABQ8ZGV4_9ROSI|nr:hypothetical protein OIU77_015413 [Salix suchowensis]
MHDFCFTIPYGLALVIGGDYWEGVLALDWFLSLLGYLSLKAFEKRKNSFLGLAIETVCAAILTFVMGQRYIQTSKMMPAGIVAGISALMTLFYLYKIATGGNHIPAKAE